MMAVELSSQWWKKAKPLTLPTAPLEKALSAYEDAAKKDMGRDGFDSFGVPALHQVSKACLDLKKKCNTKIHAETVKNLNDLEKLVEAAIQRKDADDTLLKSTAAKVAKSATDAASAAAAILTTLNTLVPAAASDLQAGMTADAIKTKHSAEISQILVAARNYGVAEKAGSAELKTCNAKVERGYGPIALGRLLSAFDGATGETAAVVKAIKDGEYNKLPFIVPQLQKSEQALRILPRAVVP